jgi:S1-C subfamily serine protease
MSDTKDWAFPAALQPDPKALAFDLDAALSAMVLVRAEIPQQAFTADILGTERAGYGVVIGDKGLVLTIGYLITEAQTVWLTTHRGNAVPGHALAYDQVTGFGLILPLLPLNVKPLPRGSINHCSRGDEVFVLGHGGRNHALAASVLDVREFAGYWEYVLDQAIFTAPAHPQWAGAALISSTGKLLGIGSLLVQEADEGKSTQGNMFVPIDLIEPILDDLITRGRAKRPPRAWLGMYVQEDKGRLHVVGLAHEGPAERAGVRVEDVVVAVAGESPSDLADFFHKVWDQGPAGTEVLYTLLRHDSRVDITIESIDRNDLLYKPQMH